MISGLCVDAERPIVIFLMGSTASGKTDTAARIFDQFSCELISVDAAQVYRGMDIGTAKPDKSFLESYPHHLIDVRNIDACYSAAEFCKDASVLIQDIHQRGNTPILVGGSMFYFSALENGLSNLPAADAQTRILIENEINEKGLAALHQQLMTIDPVSARRIAPSDSQRIQRAIELYRLTNVPPSQLATHPEYSACLGRLENPIVKITLFAADRKFLHQKIEQRYVHMLEQGLIDEVKALTHDLEAPENLTAMRTVGYRQVLDYLLNKVSHQQMVDSGIAATRQLAKRQLTWLRNQSNLVWFDICHPKTADAVLVYLGSLLDNLLE